MRLLRAITERVLVCTRHDDQHPLSTADSSDLADGIFLLPAPALVCLDIRLYFLPFHFYFSFIPPPPPPPSSSSQEDGDQAVREVQSMRLGADPALAHGPSCVYCNRAVQPLFCDLLDIGRVRKVGCPILPPPKALSRFSRNISSGPDAAAAAAAPVVSKIKRTMKKKGKKKEKKKLRKTSCLQASLLCIGLQDSSTVQVWKTRYSELKKSVERIWEDFASCKPGTKKKIK